MHHRVIADDKGRLMVFAAHNTDNGDGWEREGEYQYFANPLPDPLPALRRRLYAGLAPIANGWNARLGRPADFPADLDAFAARCHAAGQSRPTSLLLQYGPGDYNRLHQEWDAIARRAAELDTQMRD